MNKLNKLKIIYFGTPRISEKVLAGLIDEKLKIELVVTQTDKPAGRKKQLKSSNIKKFCLKNEINFKEIDTFNEKNIKKIAEIKPDLILTCAYGVILPKKIIELPRFKSINIHPSLLPDLRGPSPIQTAFLKGYTETGVSFIVMDEKMDHGNLIFQKKINIKKNDSYNDLEEEIIKTVNKKIINILDDWILGKIKVKQQNHAKSSFCQMIKKEDGKINFEKETAKEMFNKFRAFQKWPNIYCVWNNKGKKTKIILHKITYYPDKSPKHEAGRVFIKNKKVLIATKEKSLLIQEIQLEGKNILDINNFINGRKDFIGSILE